MLEKERVAYCCPVDAAVSDLRRCRCCFAAVVLLLLHRCYRLVVAISSPPHRCCHVPSASVVAGFLRNKNTEMCAIVFRYFTFCIPIPHILYPKCCAVPSFLVHGICEQAASSQLSTVGDDSILRHMKHQSRSARSTAYI